MDFLWRDKISVLVTNPLLCFQSSVYGFFCSFGYQPNATKLHCAGYTATLAKFLHPPFGNAPFCCRFSARYIVHVRTCPFYLKSFMIYYIRSNEQYQHHNMNYIGYAKELYFSFNSEQNAQRVFLKLLFPLNV